MLKIVAAMIATVLGAAALIFAAMKIYDRLYGDSARASGISSIGRLRRLYNSHANGQTPWTVVYISIYKHRLKSTVDYSKVLAVEELVKKNVEDAVTGGDFEAAAALDGKNYVLLIRGDDARIQDFCERFMSFEAVSASGNTERYASLLNIYIGIYRQVCAEVSFEEAVDNARRTAKYALETHTKFYFSSHDVQTHISEMEMIENNVDSRIENNEYYMVIQPFIGKNNEIIGGEMLSRFRAINGRDIPVHKYLRAIRKESLCGRFDYAVFEKCLNWLEQRDTVKTSIISCNFTRFTVSSPDFPKNICAIMGKYSVNPGMIGIEITEDESDINRDALLENIRAIKQMGFHIFIDDFGSGAASLDDLYSMPVDVLKVDKSLLHHADTEKGRAIFDGVCDLAKRLNLTLLCEGIENEAQAAIVDQANCDIRQGYYYYHPMLVSEYEELCRRLNEAGEE